jgi:hypothetical protein
MRHDGYLWKTLDKRSGIGKTIRKKYVRVTIGDVICNHTILALRNTQQGRSYAGLNKSAGKVCCFIPPLAIFSLSLRITVLCIQPPFPLSCHFLFTSIFMFTTTALVFSFFFLFFFLLLLLKNLFLHCTFFYFPSIFEHRT